jgi:hypothetical protein
MPFCCIWPGRTAKKTKAAQISDKTGRLELSLPAAGNNRISAKMSSGEGKIEDGGERANPLEEPTFVFTEIPFASLCRGS